MGKLIKNHWARLIILTAAAYQTTAAIYAFFWPKLFWDFLTTNLDACVRPVPILQILNLLFGILGLCWEWPLPLFTTASSTHIPNPNRHNQNHNHNTNKDPKTNLQPYQIGHHTTYPPPSHKLSTSITSHPRSSKLTSLLATMHRSIEARLLVYPLNTLLALLLYQGTNAGLYYIIGMGIYFWGFSEGEVVMGVPWTLPKKSSSRLRRGASRV